MPDVVILWAPAGRSEAGALVTRLVEIATHHGWEVAFSNDQDVHLVILATGAGKIRTQHPPHGRLVVLGEWISDQTLLEATARSKEPIEICRRLTDSGWGRYLALLLRPGGSLAGVYRDPSGALDCFITQIEGVTAIATVVPDWLLSSFEGRWQPNWDQVIELLADPTHVSGVSGVEGWSCVMPGAYQSVEPGPLSSPTEIWSPAEIAARAPPSIQDARQSLVLAVDRAVAGFADDASGCLVEVSGGLDSAIVALSLSRRLIPLPKTLVNYFGPYLEADERRYAYRVAELADEALLAAERPPPIQIASAWMNDRMGFRPGFQRLDPAYDDAQATLARSLGHTQIMTGKGGDAVFFQHCTPLVFADVIARRGPLSLLDTRLFEMARWCHQSVWNVSGASVHALARARRESNAAGRPPLQFTASDLRANTVHPWLVDLDCVRPAKRLQIAAIASNIGMHGPSAQTDACDVVHPLLSQPVLEAALAIPTIDLTEGGHDRGLARNAFADRLPDEIRLRRTKGSLAHYFGMAISDGLDALRPFLLDGLLAQRGYIDRGKLEVALTTDVLIWNAVYGDVMLLTMVESWVRGWSQTGSDSAPPSAP